MTIFARELENLLFKLEYMALKTQQAFVSAIEASRKLDVEKSKGIVDADRGIDLEEVQIEEECIRLLALHQPTAVDLRMLCFIIKVNNDIERIADKSASIAGRVRHLSNLKISIGHYPTLDVEICGVADMIDRTLRLIPNGSVEQAEAIIESDKSVNSAYKSFVRDIVDGRTQDQQDGASIERAVTLILFARSIERIGDLCTNIAEDMIFLRTGDIVRHAPATNRSHPTL